VISIGSLLRASLVAALAAGGAVVFGGRAFAADPPPAGQPQPPAPPAAKSAVAELTPDEVEAIRRHAPEWDRLDEATRERIAKLVLKLRQLTPEQRERFFERMRKLERAGPEAFEGLGKKLEGFEGMRPEARDPLVQWQFAARAISAIVLADLPAESRSLLSPEAFEEQMRLQFAIGAAWRRRVIDGLAAAPPLDFEPVAGMPEAPATELRTKRDELVAAGGAAAPEKLRRVYAERVLQARLFEWKLRLPRPDRSAMDEHVLALGRKLKDAFPAAFQAVFDEVSKAAAQGREGVEAFVVSRQPEEQRAGFRGRRLWLLVFDLERRVRPMFSSGGATDVLAKVDDLEGSVLRMLKVPDDRIRELRDAVGKEKRETVLREILEKYGPAGGGPGRVFPFPPKRK
jgi:hypothetical protein